MPTVGPVRLDHGNRAHQNLNYSILIDVVHRREQPEIKAAVGELLPDLGLKPTKGNKESLAVLVGNLFTAWLTTGNPFVVVPLRPSQYASGTRMQALFLKFKPTADTVHALDDAGYIELHRGFYSEETSRLTRIRATEKLVSLFLRYRLRLDGFQLRDNAEVVLRNAEGRDVNISRGPYAGMAKPFRENVSRINIALAAAKVELHVDEQLFIDKFLKRPDGRKAVNPPHPLHNRLTRIFNVNFDLGGRFYRHWSQGLPRELRRFIRINAEPVQEVDYKAIHPSLLYAERGQRIPAGEMYLPQGWPKGLRPAFKILMLAAVNAADLDAAVKGARDGIRHMPELRNIDEDILRNGWLLGAFEALQRLHAPIADAFFTGAGLRLQRLDSEIAERVMLNLLDNGVVALPIHDSFVVGLHAVELLRAAMSTASLEVCGQSIAMDDKWPIEGQLSLTNHDVVRKAIPVMDGGSSLTLETLPQERCDLLRGGSRMRIIIDPREQAPLDFTLFACSVEAGTLDTGDYSLKGLDHLVSIERKSIPDLVASVTRERDRFERELARARGLDLFAVVIEGTLEDVRSHNYRSKAAPHSVLQSMTAFTVRYGVNWIWASNPAGAAYFTYWTLEKYLAEAEKRFRMILKAEDEAAAKTPQRAARSEFHGSVNYTGTQA